MSKTKLTEMINMTRASDRCHFHLEGNRRFDMPNLALLLSALALGAAGTQLFDFNNLVDIQGKYVDSGAHQHC